MWRLQPVEAQVGLIEKFSMLWEQKLQQEEDRHLCSFEMSQNGFLISFMDRQSLYLQVKTQYLIQIDTFFTHPKGDFCVKLLRLKPVYRFTMETQNQLQIECALIQGCNKTFSFVVSLTPCFSARFLDETVSADMQVGFNFAFVEEKGHYPEVSESWLN